MVGVALVVDFVKTSLTTGGDKSFSYLSRVLRGRSEKQKAERKVRVTAMTGDPRVLAFWVMKSNTLFHFATLFLALGVMLMVMSIGIKGLAVWTVINVSALISVWCGIVYMGQGILISQDVHDSVFPEDAPDQRL